ncbi:DNA-binding protein [archaeon]|nr:DNA-binding protein [archaeon]|tara:strand:- start:192 stop:746 length:555 start_codon:yes stop_codon:yes gene_type:complete
MKEEKAVILDFLAEGYPDRRHPEPVAQSIGTSNFTLLELVPREDIELTVEEEVYIGEGKRDKIRYIKGSMKVADLTNVARSNLGRTVTDIVKKNEEKFIEFFNITGMLTPRMHKLQLIPGIGKKHVVDIITARKTKKFESFEDMIKRVKLFPDPVKSLVKRIMNELEGDEKYHLFTPQAPYPHD